MKVRYYAKRSVYPSRTLGDQYTLEIYLNKYDRKRKPLRVTTISLTGERSDTYQRADTTYGCSTIPLTGYYHLVMREFLDSVEGGEIFEFADSGSPENFVRVQITSKGYTERRRVLRGDGGESDYFSMQWQHREV